MKTYDKIEFDGQNGTLHGVGTLKYSVSFDVDSVQYCSMIGIDIGGEQYVCGNGEQSLEEICDVISRIAYVKNRFKPADFTANEFLGSFQYVR